MPKTKKKSVAKRNAERRSAMRVRRAGEKTDGGPDRGEGDPTGSFPDGGCNDPTDPQRSVPPASAVGPSGLGADGLWESSVLGAKKQMEVEARLSEPSGPSALNDTMNDTMKDTMNDTLNDTMNDTLNDDPDYTLNDTRDDTLNDSLNDTLDDTLNDTLNDTLDELPVNCHDACLDACRGDVQDDFLDDTDLRHDMRNDFLKNVDQYSNENKVTVEGIFTAVPIYYANTKYGSADSYIHGSSNRGTFNFGSFHQGDNRFSIESRGNQCVANSLCALAYGNYSNMTSSQDLDNVLVAGDQLYHRIIFGLKAKQRLQSKLLNFDDLPSLLDMPNRKVHITKANVTSGAAVDQFGDMELPTLHQALHTAFQSSNHILVLIGAICSAVYLKDGLYYFFDSHSHDHNGLSSVDGFSVLASFDSLEDLVGYMYSMYNSMLIDLTSQYELLPLVFSEVESTVFHQAPDTFATTDHCQVDAHRNMSHMDSPGQWKTVIRGKEKSKREGKKAKSASQDIQEVEPKLKKSVKGYTIISTDEEDITLIGRYFKDQMQKNTSKQKHHKKEENRKTYLKLYKQSQRRSAAFKKKETEAKQQARQSNEMTVKERRRTLKSMAKARQSATFKEKETKAKRQARQADEMMVKERERALKSMAKARQSATFKEKETKAKQQARQADEMMVKEIKRTLNSMAKARQSATFKEKETKAKQRARQADEMMVKERERALKSMAKARQSAMFKEKETKAKQQARQADEMTVKERKRTLNSMAKARQSATFKEKETKAKRQARQADEMMVKERERAVKSMAKARQSATFKEKETKAKQQARQADEMTVKERKRTLKSMAKARQSADYKNNEKQSKRRARLIEEYRQWELKNQGLYKKKVRSDPSNLERERIRKQIPKLSVINGMEWPGKPKELELFPLEERLISLRIPFMQIRELPRGRQYSVKGNVVNVPTELQPVVDTLPRPVDENVVVAVKLKKKLSYSSCAFTENIRPFHVLVALHWLMKHSALYKNSNVDVDEEWVQNISERSKDILREFIRPEAGNEEANKVDHVGNPQEVQDINDENLCDSETEETDHLNVGNIDTLIDHSDLENRTETFTFAPGEGQTPLSIYRDVDSEYMCFPTIFCGERRKSNEERSVPVKYSDVAKWELRSVDRRAANSVPNIFYKLKKIQMKQLNDRVNLVVRQCQFRGKSLTASQARDENHTEEFVRKDQGYFIFKQLRNSPAYLESLKKDIFAMIRQLGLPTWFMSLSSADTRWTDLLKMLAKLNYGAPYTDEKINNMTWEEKTKLVQKDPVTCSRYFDHRVQEFIKTVLKSDHNPIGRVTDHFYRVEFQQRGSPHIHMIVWVDGAPKLMSNSHEEITTFVDQYLKCFSGNDNQELIQLQVHKHSRTCRKKEDTICRFGYPLPPLEKTMVLEPLDSDIDKYKKMYSKLQKRMNSEKEGFDMCNEEFLLNVAEMSEEDYIKSIRSSLKASKVFLKRSPKDIRVNLYNETVLHAWKANMDMQFVLDPYACAMYIVSYISKSQRGMSNLMHAAVKEAKSGNMDIKRQVRHVGNVFFQQC